MEDFPPVEPQPQKPEDDRPSIGKQILGAVIGGALALSLYYTYDYAKPKVTAYLTLPVAEGGRKYDLGASHIADKTTDAGNRKRILSRGLRAAGMLQDNAKNDPSLLETVDNHALDIAWPGHDENSPKYAEAIAQDLRPGVANAVAEKVEEWEKDVVDQGFDVQMIEEEMATQSMETSDAWEDLWGDIREEEDSAHSENEHENSDGLTDTGFGLGVILAGAVGGTLGARRKKKL